MFSFLESGLGLIYSFNKYNWASTNVSDLIQITKSTVVKLKEYMDIGRILINSNTQYVSPKGKMA